MSLRFITFTFCGEWEGCFGFVTKKEITQTSVAKMYSINWKHKQRGFFFFPVLIPSLASTLTYINQDWF